MGKRFVSKDQFLHFLNLKEYNSKDRASLAYASIMKTLFQGGDGYDDFAKMIDKKLKDSRHDEIGSFHTPFSIEKAYKGAHFWRDYDSCEARMGTNNRDNDYMTPMSIELFELFMEGRHDEIIKKVNQLPLDYEFETRFEGYLLLLMQALKDKEYGVVESAIASAAVAAQYHDGVFPMQCLLGRYVRMQVSPEHRPWMMRDVLVEEINGKTYYCMPFMMPAKTIAKQYRIHKKSMDSSPGAVENFNAFDVVPTYKDRSGTTYMSGTSALAASMTTTLQASMSAVTQLSTKAIGSAIKYAQKGNYDLFIGAGCLASIRTSKKTLFPLGTCGYVITTNRGDFEEWEESLNDCDSNSSKLSHYTGIYNLVDNAFYEDKNGELPDSLRYILKDVNSD